MPIAETQVRLKGNLYARPDYFSTDVSRGSTRTPTGTRICSLTSDFLLGFRDALIYECGKSFRPVMKTCGRRWGAAFVLRFEQELSAAYQVPMNDLPAGVVHACLDDAFNYHGWGRLSVDLSASDAGVIQAEVTDSIMPSLVHESDRPVDHLLSGLLAAIFSRFSGAELGCVQTDCVSTGAASSRFVITSTDRAAEIEAWLESGDGTGATPSHDAVVRRLSEGSTLSRDGAVGGLEPGPTTDCANSSYHEAGANGVADHASVA